MSEANYFKSGRSLIVPSVQELSEQGIPWNNNTIPERYLRLDQDPPSLSATAGNDFPAIPVVDVQALLCSGSQELQKLHSACQDWGFFQIVNHGVSASLMEDLRIEVTQLFELPMEEKRKLWQQPDNQEGFGQLFVVSENQKLDWSDMFYITTLPHGYNNDPLLHKLPTKLRETMEAYSTEMKRLAMTLLGQMAKALKMDYDEIRHIFEHGVQSMRMNYYPPCPQPDIAIGFAPHSDADALTILFQLNDTEGLQIRKDGKWVVVKPLHDAFVVNLGNMIEIMSNGVYRSIEHRATVNSSQVRLSVATFYSHGMDSELGPSRSLVGPKNPPMFRTINTRDYFEGFFARKLSGKSYLDFMRLENP